MSYRGSCCRPYREACLGGLEYGESSCEEGYSGLLCGTCVAGYYRGRMACLACADRDAKEGVGQATLAAAALKT